MRIWVDAERTPRGAHDIVRRAGARLGVSVRSITSRDIEPGGDRTQVRALLVACAEPGDVVVTADDVVGSELAGRGVVAIDVRGEEFVAPAAAAPQTLDLLSSVRSFVTGDSGPPPFDGRAKRAFAATLDRVLARLRPAFPDRPPAGGQQET